MDIAVLLLSMCFFFAIGMPIAYALALSALVGALWIDFRSARSCSNLPAASARSRC